MVSFWYSCACWIRFSCPQKGAASPTNMARRSEPSTAAFLLVVQFWIDGNETLAAVVCVVRCHRGRMVGKPYQRVSRIRRGLGHLDDSAPSLRLGAVVMAAAGRCPGCGGNGSGINDRLLPVFGPARRGGRRRLVHVTVTGTPSEARVRREQPSASSSSSSSSFFSLPWKMSERERASPSRQPGRARGLKQETARSNNGGSQLGNVEKKR